LLTLAALTGPALADPAPPGAAPDPAPPPAGAPPGAVAAGDPARDGHAAARGGHRRTTIIETDAAGPWRGAWGLGVAQALGRRFALRGEGALVHTLDGHQRGYQGRASLAFYFHRAFSGPFVESGMGFRNVEKTCTSCGSDDMDRYRSNLDLDVTAMAGWHLVLDPGVSVAVAVGLVERIDLAQGILTVEPAGYIRLGYAF
jgi:hypothetical protein